MPQLQVLLLVAYMALGRIKTVEQLQYYSPGELGKLMGLDRVPEVRCLRNKLAEMGSWVGSKRDGLWVREVRKLCKDGHQTSLISTAKASFAIRDAARVFSRWSRENFFAYMEKHFAYLRLLLTKR
jgi:hypothetical protein